MLSHISYACALYTRLNRSSPSKFCRSSAERKNLNLAVIGTAARNSRGVVAETRHYLTVQICSLRLLLAPSPSSPRVLSSGTNLLNLTFLEPVCKARLKQTLCPVARRRPIFAFCLRFKQSVNLRWGAACKRPPANIFRRTAG